MKRSLTAMLLLAVMGCMHSSLYAAELLDVKPVVAAGGSVSVEISADIAMTYTYYKVPGQARAVVDIAEADPEKVEPLIVVNKGLVSSISVDKAQITGIAVSRIVFNLVSDADISVTASPDRTLLTVTFGGTPPEASKPGIKPDLAPEIKPAAVPKPVSKAGPPAVVTAPAPAASASASASAIPPALPPTPTAARTVKLEPVVPIETAPVRSSALTIQEIITGTKYIEIRANQAIPDYKALKLTSPDRLVIDMASGKTDQKPKTVAINNFGISKVRIGVTPTNIRIVMDSSKAGFPVYSITKTENGLRINFK